MNEKATDEMLRYVGGLWPDAAKEKATERKWGEQYRVIVDKGFTPLHCLCYNNEKATDEMLRYVGGLWSDAAKEKDEVRTTLAPPG